MVARLIVRRDAAGSLEDGIWEWGQRGWFRRREMMVSEKREGGFGGERVVVERKLDGGEKGGCTGDL